MSEQELVLNVKELHVLSLTCSECGHGTIFDFKSSDYLENSVSPKCSICKTELPVNLQEQLQAYRCFYDSMSACGRIEFRVRLYNPEAAAVESASAAASESAAEVQQAVSTAVTEVQQAVAKALAKEHGMADLVGGPFLGFGSKD
jgi:DNA-directed RNA polymerase subunit RPC12/RpoP